MNKDFFQIKLPPDPYEAFNLSQGIIFEQLLFISGQTSVDETGELLFPKDFKAQANQAFQNLEKVLLAGDSSFLSRHGSIKGAFTRGRMRSLQVGVAFIV